MRGFTALDLNSRPLNCAVKDETLNLALRTRRFTNGDRVCARLHADPVAVYIFLAIPVNSYHKFARSGEVT